MLKISDILKTKLYWQLMSDRINEKDMQQVYCKKCEGDCYKQQDEEKISWIFCTSCGYKERVYSYFKTNVHKTNLKS